MSDDLDELKRKQALAAAEAEALQREIERREAEQKREAERREYEEYLRLTAKFGKSNAPAASSPAAPITMPAAQVASPPTESSNSKTIADLVRDYRAGTAYAGLRFKTRDQYDAMMNRILKDRGHEVLAALKLKDLWDFYNAWTKNGSEKIATGHALMTMLRILFSFGVAVQDDPDCVRLQVAMHHMRFKTARNRSQGMTTEQALNLIKKAHEMGLPSIALAQAFQIDLALNQKDVIGEWIPIDVDGPGHVAHDGMKWGRGLLWEEVGDDLVLRHVMSSRGNLLERSLKDCPNVIAQLATIYGAATRDAFPKKGPMIIREVTALPWPAHEFRRQWRRIATACEIPEEVRNMDTSRRSETKGGTKQLREDKLASSVLSRNVH